MSGVYGIYPARSVALYNGVTLLYFGLATAGLLVSYGRWPVMAWVLALSYLAVALGSSVSGGSFDTAAGNKSSVSGGANRPGRQPAGQHGLEQAGRQIAQAA